MTSAIDASHLTVVLDGQVHSVFQPIVDLDTGRVAALEALARGPEGPLHGPAALFDLARAEGRLAELDAVCRRAAVTGALSLGLPDALTVFVNVEPEVLETAPLEDLLALADQGGDAGRLRIVLEVTERALAARPAELLHAVQRVREQGWGLALDDVGAESASLAFMPLLRPDVVKLDMRLVQDRPSPAVAEIMNAVNAYAESSGALVLAEGIETQAHLDTARALGASLGQGWLFGRPTADPMAEPRDVVTEPLALPQLPDHGDGSGSPFGCLPAGAVLRVAPKRLLVEISKQLEREAMRIGETCVVAATFQHARHFTPATTVRYHDLVERTGFVCAIGEGMPGEPLPGLLGVPLEDGDPVLGEWDVTVLGPHFAAGLLARDLGDEGPDMNRRFEYALTYTRTAVVAATDELLRRVRPAQAPSPAAPDLRPRPVAAPSVTVDHRTEAVDVGGLLDVTTNGVTVVDLTRPDQPLVYVNAAFERLAGYPREQLIGRNCRLLQGADTDRDTVRRIRAALAAGEECHEVLLNRRGPEQTPWWNEMRLSPVRDATGRVVRYIGVQNDVTDRVEAQRALRHEAERSRSYLEQIERLAFTDPLTGLLNRRGLEERVEAELWEARASESALALLYLDLDAFKAVNDSFGHAAGDEVLRVVARRLERAVRRTDLVARLGGDEFLVAVTGLDPESASRKAHEMAMMLAEVVGRPVRAADQDVVTGGSIGVSLYPGDGTEFGRLLHVADRRMYDLKHPGA